jgi:hypothetical protein
LLNPYPGRCPGLICSALSGLNPKGINSFAKHYNHFLVIGR